MNLRLRILRLLSGIVFLLAAAVAGFAGTYYVATNGNDGAEGSEESPWRSVAFAVDQTGPGDTIIVRGGTYRESLVWFRTDRRRAQSRQWRRWRRDSRTFRDPTIPRNGSPRDRHQYEPGQPDAPWVLKAYPGEAVIFENERPIRIQAPYVRVEGFHFKGMGVGVVNINGGGGHHVEIVNNRLTGSGYRYGAISVSGDSNLVAGNLVQINEQAGTLDHGIYIQQSRGTVVRDNFVSGPTGYGIHLFCEDKGRGRFDDDFSISNVVIENNVITGSKLRSGMIVATGRGNTVAQDVTIRNNLIYGNKGNGIDIRRTVNGIEIYNNTLYKNGGDGVTLGFVARQGGDVENIVISNNIIVLEDGDRYHVTSNPEAVIASTVVVENNLFWPSPVRLNELDGKNNRAADPRFLDADAGNFSLSSDSPAIDAGVKLAAAFAGTAPDLGAVELGGVGAEDVPVAGLHARPVGNLVHLTWFTWAEHAEVGFEIERAPANDPDSFTKIGFVDGQGPKATVQEYRYVDEGVGTGTYHYRVKVIDAGGGAAYSPAIRVKVNGASGAESSKKEGLQEM